MNSETIQVAAMLKCAGLSAKNIRGLLQPPAPMCTDALVEHGVSITKAIRDVIAAEDTFPFAKWEVVEPLFGLSKQASAEFFGRHRHVPRMQFRD